MAQLGQAFDPNSVAPSTGGGGGLHPKGDYEFEIRTSEVAANSKGTGKVLKLEIHNTGRDDPALKDKMVYANINLEHTSAQAQTIGQAEFSALCAAIGETGMVDDSDQLHFRPFYARIDHEQAKDFKNNGALKFKDNGDPMMNAIVRRYLFEDGEQPPAAQQQQQAQQRQAPPPQQQQQAQQPAAGGQRTWQKRT